MALHFQDPHSQTRQEECVVGWRAEAERGVDHDTLCFGVQIEQHT